MIRIMIVKCKTHLRSVGSSHRYPLYLPSGHGRCWISSFGHLERTIGSIASSWDDKDTSEVMDTGRAVILTYRSTRSAYSNILIRRMRSSFTFSKDRRSPSRSAILACTRVSRLCVGTEVVGQGRTLISARSISHSLRSRSYLRHSVCRKWRTEERVKSWPLWGGGSKSPGCCSCCCCCGCGCC